MVRTAEGRFGILAVGFLALAGCDEAELGNLFNSGDTPAQATAEGPSPRASGSVQVVEAPEIFDVAETALWDGRPSLGLIWVAYEGADPTNVIIRNEQNGKFVVGALYRRERFFPGPPFQLSSDAAAELGILAGQPTEIRVVALKEEAAEVAPEVVEDEEVPADIGVEGEVSEGELAVTDAGETDVDVDPIGLAAAAAIEAADPTPVEVAPLVPAVPARRPTVEGPNAPLPRLIAAPPPAEIAPMAAIEPLEITTAEPLVAPIAAPRSGVSSLEKPFIQIGIFAVQENANGAAKTLADAGIIPFVEEQRVGGRDFYRVVVGPATNANERATLLAQVKAQGFGDAYFVKN